jgi:hypothetical protein
MLFNVRLKNKGGGEEGLTAILLNIAKQIMIHLLAHFLPITYCKGGNE